MVRGETLTFEALERRLGVRRAAVADAAAERPHAGDPELSATERAICQAVDAARARIEADRRAAASAAERAARRAQAAAAAPADPEHAQARLGLRMIEGRFAKTIADARARAQRAAGDLDSFRRTHDLRRPAIYPASALLAGALLVLAAALEAFLSATLFDADVAGGLLAAAAVSGGLGAANVTLGFFGGFLGLRYLQHRRLGPRAMGIAALAAAGLVALGLNLFAADWRERIRVNHEAQTAQAARLQTAADLRACLSRISADAAPAQRASAVARCRAKHAIPAAAAPQAGFLGLTTPEAVVLLLLGVGVWAFAALKGFSGVDDPYPDYGKLDRAARRAAEDLDDIREEAQSALDEPIEGARDAAETAAERRREALAHAEAAYETAAEQLAPLEEETRRLDRAQAALLALYRSENARRRTTPPPEWFNDPAREAAPLPDALAQAGVALTAARLAAAEAQARAAQALEALGQELATARARLDGEAPAFAVAPT